MNLSCQDALRYLGKKVPADGYGCWSGEAQRDLRTRGDGARLKCWYHTNALQCYDKEKIALRLETTRNSPKEYQVFRTQEGEAGEAPPSWQPLRQGVAELPRRAAVSDAANNRLAESRASVAAPATLGELLRPLGRAVVQDGRRVARALPPLTGDGELLRALAAGEYLRNGFGNRDRRGRLLGPGPDAPERRRHSAQVTRWLGWLKAPGRLLKVPKPHRSPWTAQGRRVVTAWLSAHHATAEQLLGAA